MFMNLKLEILGCNLSWIYLVAGQMARQEQLITGLRERDGMDVADLRVH